MTLIGLNIHDTDDFRLAALPLFESDEVDVLEYSFDNGWSGEPEWLCELVDYYASQNRLLGHGVTFSPLSGAWETRQEEWLVNLKRECQRRSYLHISEHFGFMTAGSFHQSAPLPVPRTEGALRVGIDRLKKLAQTSSVPIGLENLAFAFGPQDVHEQGSFLEQLLAPVDGFLLLDLHNLYCQSANFKVPACELLESYPLERVRELHVSGGSWSESNGEAFRRDTHDGPVPEEVFELLPVALRRCPNVHAVIFERMGGTIPTDGMQAQMRDDYRRIAAIVRGKS